MKVYIIICACLGRACLAHRTDVFPMMMKPRTEPTRRQQADEEDEENYLVDHSIVLYLVSHISAWPTLQPHRSTRFLTPNKQTTKPDRPRRELPRLLHAVDAAARHRGADKALPGAGHAGDQVA